MTTGETITVRATLAPEDLMAIVRKEFRATKFALRIRVLALSVGLAVALCVCLDAIVGLAKLTVLDVGALFLLAWSCWLVWEQTSYRRWSAGILKRPYYRAYFLGPVLYKFDSVGISVERQLQRSWFSWLSVTGLDSDSTRIIVLVAGTSTVVIPRRTFLCDLEWDVFRARLAALQAAAGQFTPECPKCKHDLRGTDGQQCTECGWRVAPLAGS